MLQVQVMRMIIMRDVNLTATIITSVLGKMQVIVHGPTLHTGTGPYKVYEVKR